MRALHIFLMAEVEGRLRHEYPPKSGSGGDAGSVLIGQHCNGLDFDFQVGFYEPGYLYPGTGR
jgi:hypothetical protein